MVVSIFILALEFQNIEFKLVVKSIEIKGKSRENSLFSRY